MSLVLKRFCQGIEGITQWKWRTETKGANFNQFWIRILDKQLRTRAAKCWLNFWSLAFNSGQSSSGFQASGWWANSSGQNNYNNGGSNGWVANAGKSSSSSGRWQNKSAQRTSSSNQDENPINWDGLVEDVFKKEIGQMAEDLKETKPTWKWIQMYWVIGKLNYISDMKTFL